MRVAPSAQLRRDRMSKRLVACIGAFQAPSSRMSVSVNTIFATNACPSYVPSWTDVPVTMAAAP